MSKIIFSASNVQANVSLLKETYIELENKLAEMNVKKDQLSQFWSSTEANRFSANLLEVSQAFIKFKEKYDGYLEFLDSVITAYSNDSLSFLSTINSIAVSTEEK